MAGDTVCTVQQSNSRDHYARTKSESVARRTNPAADCPLAWVVLKSVEPGHAVFEMEADERYHNPMGTLHGGVYRDLADAAMGYAYADTLGEGETFTTIELKINFSAPYERQP